MECNRRYSDVPIVVPEFDLLAEQTIQMADRRQSAGVPVDLEVYRGAVHSFLEAVSIAPLAERAFADTATWLRAPNGLFR